MKVLYVTGSNLAKNTSANMSHNGYVQGLLENDASLDIIMAGDSYGENDTKLKQWEGIRYFVYPSLSWVDKFRAKGRNVVKSDISKGDTVGAESKKNTLHTLKSQFRSLLKRLFFLIFKPDPVYPMDRTWLKNASKFQSSETYDLIVSNSSPAASHRLVAELLRKGRVKCNRWIQIWEDPWYHDLYGGHTDAEFAEELSLLQSAQEVFYVSPLTLHYQIKFFPDCADKMGFVPLPFLKFSEGVNKKSDIVSFGYFGDFYSVTRNLQPFYDALVESGAKGNIYGDSDLNLKSTNNITISGRVTLDVLGKVQEETTVLVHLCNLRGGQIPGKIYHYSATEKPILFILDGTENEQKIIRDYFSQFNRYCFCSNNKEDITSAIRKMTANIDDYVGHVVREFSPKFIVGNLLNNFCFEHVK